MISSLHYVKKQLPLEPELGTIVPAQIGQNGTACRHLFQSILAPKYDSGLIFMIFMTLAFTDILEKTWTSK